MNSLSNAINSIGKLNFFLLTMYLLDPFTFGYIFGAILLLKNISDFKKIDKELVILLIFSICYSLFYLFDLSLGAQYVLIYCFFPSGFYLIGRTFYKEDMKKEEIFIFLFFIGLIFSMPSMISVLVAIFQKGFVVANRSVPYIFSGIKTSATNMASFFILNMSIPAFLLANYRRFNLYFKIISILTFLLSILCILRIGSRTQLSLFLITFLVSTIYLFKRQTVKQNIALTSILGLLFVVFLSTTPIDKNSTMMSAFTSRMESKKYGAETAGGRTERWEKSLINIWEKPMGWSLDDFSYSHNMWLDVSRVGGFISFILLLIFSIRNAYKTKKAINLNSNNILLNTLFLCYSLSFYLMFMVEPIFEGYFSLFVLFCFFSGIIGEYITKTNAINS